jgi:D-arabinose 1-dehydrogenase-like Zn-dependent alcohol dehydrogenase
MRAPQLVSRPRVPERSSHASGPSTGAERSSKWDELKGQVAMVVGASRGLGRGIAEGFHDAGASVIAVARSAAALDQLAKEYFVSGAHR